MRDSCYEYTIIYSAGLGRCTDYGSTQIQNGYRTIEGTTEGDMVAFGCNDGYDLIGNRQLTCGSNGRWIGAWPICARGQCSVIPCYAIVSHCDGGRPASVCYLKRC